jgi:hypothetical protein
MYRTSNVINPNTNSNPVKLQNQIQQQKNFFNLINLDNSSGTDVNGVLQTPIPSDSGGKISDDMKTENVMVTTVKVEPINYTVANNQQYNENMYTKRPRLER